MKYDVLPEGALVSKLAPGMGGDAAGLVPGDLLLSADGTPLPGKDREAVRRLITGPSGSSVELTVQAPFSTEVRTVSVQRGLPGKAGPRAPAPKAVVPEVVREWRHAMRLRGRMTALRATRRMVRDGFGGMAPGAAAQGGLRLALKRKIGVAEAVADRLRPFGEDDGDLAAALAEVYFRAGRLEDANHYLARAKALATPDLTLIAGEPVWVGGQIPLGRLEVDLRLARGERDLVGQTARELARVHDLRNAWAKIGMAPVDGEPWRAELLPVRPFKTRLTDDSPWDLEDKRGKVVLLSFWATWCGPCMEELPELVELGHQRADQDLEILAVSLDNGLARDEVVRVAAELGIDFPVTHAPPLGPWFQVGALPAVRIIGRDGVVHYSAKGYSKPAMDRLIEAVDRALADDGSGGVEIGRLRVGEQAELMDFLPISGVRDVVVGPESLAVGVAGGTPLMLGFDGESLAEPDLTAGSASPSERLAWVDGPVGANPGRRWVRAWDADGMERWMVTTGAPVVDIAAADGVLWVATQSQVVAVDADGRRVASHAGGMRDLAAAADGGVWAVDGEQRWRMSLADGVIRADPAGPAPGSVIVGPRGEHVNKVASDIIVGAFGPEGAARVVVARPDGFVLGLDEDGTVAFSLQLRHPGRIAAVDRDGDGQDELVMTLRDLGVATVALRLP